MTASISIKRILVFIVFLIIGVFSIPLSAGDLYWILLNETEKDLVDQGEIILRETDIGKKNGRTFEAAGIIKAPVDVISGVLADYEHYPEFMPNVSRVEIMEQTDTEAVLNYTLKLPLGKIKKYRLKITLTRPDPQTSLIQWEYRNWPGLKAKETIKDTTGFWMIKEQADNRSMVLYHVYTDPGPVPPGLGWIVDILSKNSVPEAFLKTRSRAEDFARPNLSR